MYDRRMCIQCKMKKMNGEHQQHIVWSNLQTIETERQLFAEDLHDGSGFKAKGQPHKWIGLSHVTHRMKMIGGTCLFTSGKGFEAIIRIRLKVAEG